MTEELITQTEARITGTTDAWRIRASDSTSGREVTIELSSESDGAQGVHLVMAPEGFFAADCWYASKQERWTTPGSCSA